MFSRYLCHGNSSDARKDVPNCPSVRTSLEHLRLQTKESGNQSRTVSTKENRWQGHRIANGESDENLVTHAAVAEATRKLFRVQLLGEAQVDVAGVIESFDLVGRKGQVEAGEVVLQLSELSGAENRDDRNRALAKPGQGDLGHAATDLVGNLFDGSNDTIGTLLLGAKVLHHLAA